MPESPSKYQWPSTSLTRTPSPSVRISGSSLKAFIWVKSTITLPTSSALVGVAGVAALRSVSHDPPVLSLQGSSPGVSPIVDHGAIVNNPLGCSLLR